MRIDTGRNLRREIYLGRQGENAARAVEFNTAEWERIYGSGTLVAVALRRGDANPYPVTLTDNVWTISAADTSRSGRGKLQLSWLVGDAIKKSVIFETFVDESLSANTVDPPEPYRTYVDEMIEVSLQVQDNADRVENLLSNISYTDTGNGNIVISMGG